MTSIVRLLFVIWHVRHLIYIKTKINIDNLTNFLQQILYRVLIFDIKNHREKWWWLLFKKKNDDEYTYW